MKLFNCNLQEAPKVLGGKKIVFFGQGGWLSTVRHSELMELSANFAYVVDNNPQKEVVWGEICMKVYTPDILLKEKQCVIIISSPIYMYDMYRQLEKMNLSDDIWCGSFPFMQMVTPNKNDTNLLKKVINRSCQPKIPKIIHSFWFSGEGKPDMYRKCIETWHQKLPDYDIREWNLDNYDWRKHPFLERAIELKAWAFASDYARLDVLNEYGGIYLDMDVEVFKPFDPFLGNECILSFSNHVLIDLAVVGASKHNEMVQALLKLYDVVELPNDKKDYSKFFQPAFIREALVKAGVLMNGSLQVLDHATVFPCTFFMPQDHVLFKDFEIGENTYCVHYDNFGWSYDGKNKREKKIKENNLMWDIIQDVGDSFVMRKGIDII